MKKVMIIISVFTVMSYAAECFVVNIPSNDTLNVRVEAGTHKLLVGELPYDAMGVEVSTCKYDIRKQNWCHIEYTKEGNSLRGWVSAKYLEPVDSFTNLKLMASASNFNEPEPIVVEVENKVEAKIVKKQSFIFIDTLTQSTKEEIQSFLNTFTKDIKIKIAGNTNAMGKEEDNFTLSLQKAKLTKVFLINELGYKKEQVITMGYGEKNPICKDDNKDEFSKQCSEINSRVDIEVSGSKYLNKNFLNQNNIKEELLELKKKQINIIYESLKSGRDSSVCASNKKSCKRIIKVNKPIISKDACKVVYKGEIEGGSFMLSFDFQKGMGWRVPFAHYTSDGNYIIFDYDKSDMIPGLNTQIKYDEGSYYIKLISFFDGFIERDFSAQELSQSFRELHKVCYVK